MDFAASNERFGQWVGTEDATKRQQRLVLICVLGI